MKIEKITLDKQHVLNPGRYRAKVLSALVKDNKAGTGTYINLQFRLVDYDETIYKPLVITHPSDAVVSRARKELYIIMHAKGIEELNDTDQLINAVVDVVLDYNLDNGNRLEVRRILDVAR